MVLVENYSESFLSDVLDNEICFVDYDAHSLHIECVANGDEYNLVHSLDVEDFCFNDVVRFILNLGLDVKIYIQQDEFLNNVYFCRFA